MKRAISVRRLVVALAGAISLAAPASASAIDISGVTVTPGSPQAGANSDLDIGFDLAGGQLKDLIIHLPPGLVGNPLATPLCLEEQLEAASCPAASDVGDISNDVIVSGLIPLTASGEVYNVVPRAGEPARFGFVLNAAPPVTQPIILQSAAALRPDDFGLDTILRDVPNTANGLPIEITGVDLSLAGQVGSPPQGFLRNPTSCGTNTFTVDATGYDASTDSDSDAFDTTGCDAVPFSPEFSAEIRQSGPITEGVEVSTTISQTIEEAGLERAQVTLPADLAGNQAALANQCPATDFDAGSCPENTRVGTARATSPLQATPLTGDVFVVASTTGAILPDLGVDLRGALALKLKGAIALTPELRSMVTFDGLPDIPIADFTLSFLGGPAGLSAARRNLCKPPAPVFDTSFLAHSGATLDLATPASVSCIEEPTATVRLKTPKAGDPVLKLKLKQGSAAIRSAKLRLPKGLSFGPRRDVKAGSKVTADGKRLKKGVKAKRRSLNLKLKGAGAKRVKGRFAEGAVIADGKLEDDFGLTVRDADGERFKLTVAAK